MDGETAPPWQGALDGHRLIVTGFGRWGGGVYDLTDGVPVALDDIATSGAAVGGGRLWRVLRSPGEQTGTCELLSYDARGVRSYQRLDQIRDPHDVCWFDDAPHISSSWDDAVWRVHADGSAERVWQGSTVADGWHVNSLAVVDGALHVCAFGRYGRHKAWKRGLGDRSVTPAGFVHDLVAGRDRLTGLAHPHTPRRHDGRWYVCQSALGDLTELDGAGRVLRQVAVRRFTRGLAILGGWAVVGGNAHREQDGDRAEIVTVDLESFEVVDRVAMPCLEVYDIVAVPAPLAHGLAVGLGANASRAVEQHRRAGRPADQRSTPDQVAVHLASPHVAAQMAGMARPFGDAAARLVGVRAELPATVPAGAVLNLTVEVLNRSSRPLGSVPPRPVRVGARWIPLDRVGGAEAPDAPPAARGPAAATQPDLRHLRHDGDDGRQGPDGDGGRLRPARNPLVPLPRIVQPGMRSRLDLPVEVPSRPGCYEVRIALRQAGVGWFGVRAQGEVTVEACDVADRPEGSRSPADTSN